MFTVQTGFRTRIFIEVSVIPQNASYESSHVEQTSKQSIQPDLVQVSFLQHCSSAKQMKVKNQTNMKQWWQQKNNNHNNDNTKKTKCSTCPPNNMVIFSSTTSVNSSQQKRKEKKENTLPYKKAPNQQDKLIDHT